MKRAPRILIVEDDPDIRGLVALTLEAEGYDVALAKNGGEGLTALAGPPPALVLLDLRMPGLDGWAFCEALRAHEHHAVPVVVMSGATDAPEWLDRLGASALLAKPFDLRELVALVEAHRSR